jgi:lipooligosaccharide transport system permease protein
VSTALPLRVVEHQARIYSRFWRSSVFAYILTPLMFLAAIGFGVGGLVEDNQSTVEGFSYLVFVTPGLLAASAMQGAAGESLWPIMAGTKWIRVFHAMVATPIRPSDVCIGVLLWTAVRAAGGAVIFLVIAALLGGIDSFLAPLAIPAAALTAAAFAAPLGAFAATQETDIRFPVIMRLGIVPLFLFSGSFFPVDDLPAGLRPVARFTPLWHAVELCRDLTTGRIDLLVDALHLGVLLGCIALGAAWGFRTFPRRLAS